MLFLILAVLAGIGFALFAVQNTVGVPVHLGTITFTNAPLYAIALGSLLLGLAVSGIMRMIDWAATGLTLRGKDNYIRKTEATVEHLQQRIHDLELENARLKNEEYSTTQDTDDHHTEERPAFLQRLRHNIS